MKINDDEARPYIGRSAWVYREYARSAAKGPTTKATAIARAKFDGLAEGADAMDLVMTPHAFFMAVKEAFEAVGDLTVNVTGGAEQARAARLAWTDAMYAAVKGRLS